jgi:WD40 repeat protein
LERSCFINGPWLISWRSQDDLIAFVAADSRLKVWDLTTDDVDTQDRPGRMRSIAFSPDGNNLAAVVDTHLVGFDVK